MYNFEIHITVNIINDENTINKFKHFCLNDVHVKPLVILVKNKNSESNNKQVMTSDSIKTDSFSKALSIAKEQVAVLENGGYIVERVKIESCPNFIKDNINFDYKYMEIHIPCNTKILNDYKDTLNIFSKMYGVDWHISNNEFKEGLTFITHRNMSKKGLVDTNYLNDIIYFLEEKEISFDKNIKKIFEYAVYDSNIDVDKNWIG